MSFSSGRTVLGLLMRQSASRILGGVTVQSPAGVGALQQMGQASSMTNRVLQRGPLTSFIRCFSESAPQGSKGSWTAASPVTMKSLLVTLMLGAGMIAGVKEYKDQKINQVMQASQKVVGKAAVGGPFSLIDQDGKQFSSRQLDGEFSLLYFGFTHCPDICPDELEKIAQAIDLVDKRTGVKIQIVFISVDPERDTPAKVKEYIKEFHPRMIGLTGNEEDVKRTSKLFRVYYNKTGKEGDKDYLVDHSIIHYLLDPEGEFSTFYGKNNTAEMIADSLHELVANWKSEHPGYHEGRAIPPPPPKKAKVTPVNKAAQASS